MRSFIAFLAALSLCQARPQRRVDVPGVSSVRSVEPYVVGGNNASPGEFPWQLSLQQLTSSWTHVCGAILLSTRYGLTSARCVNGVLFSDFRVYAGLWDRSDTSGAQLVYLDGYTVHANFMDGYAYFSDDIAILNFETLVTIGGDVQVATLPTSNDNDYAGTTCAISGWGLTAPETSMPNILQKAYMQVLTTAQCANAMSPVSQVTIWDNHICVQDLNANVGACDGDHGGPLSCPDGVIRVVGVASWTIVNGNGYCYQTYPSVATRISGYLDWIAANTPADSEESPAEAHQSATQ